MITNAQINESFVNPQMRTYFYRKLPELKPAEIDTRIEELLKYLNMAVYSSGDIPFTSEIDDIWHLWILETQEYAALCEKLHGGRFMHHSSSAYLSQGAENSAPQTGNFIRAVEILMSYVLNYGDFEEDRIRYWPVAEHLYERFDRDLQKLNGWLHEKIEQCSQDVVAVRAASAV